MRNTSALLAVALHNCSRFPANRLLATCITDTEMVPWMIRTLSSPGMRTSIAGFQWP
jgi:hypothetical protein